MSDMTGVEIAARARALLGVRFRPQGRSAESGLDCIGLVAAALGVEDARADYALRGGSIAELERELAAAGLSRVAGGREGDVFVMRAGPEQLHLGIWTGSAMVHADAGLRRIVERPGRPEWDVIGVWRMRPNPPGSRNWLRET
jgi:hypothetical protein